MNAVGAGRAALTPTIHRKVPVKSTETNGISATEAHNRQLDAPSDPITLDCVPIARLPRTPTSSGRWLDQAERPSPCQLALSRDRGTQTQAVDQGYGFVGDLSGRPYPSLIVTAANHEHGIIGLRPGFDGVMAKLPVGTRVRILPNLACETAGQHEGYVMIDTGGNPDDVVGRLARFRGW